MEHDLNTAMVAQIVLLGRELDRGEAELRAIIDAMSQEAQARLVAVTWIGRGAFEAEEWAEAVTTAAQEATTPCADYILGMPHFTDHLEAGMNALGLELTDDEGTLVHFA